jgi:hypothetical protein
MTMVFTRDEGNPAKMWIIVESWSRETIYVLAEVIAQLFSAGFKVVQVEFK